MESVLTGADTVQANPNDKRCKDVGMICSMVLISSE